MTPAGDKDDPITLDVEVAIDGYLAEVANRGTADLDRWAAKVVRGPARDRFRREASAEEYSYHVSKGEDVALEAYLDRFGEPVERSAFLKHVSANNLAAHTVPAQHPPGSLIGARYRVRDMIGRGGMSVVYAAFDTELEREVAIKVFNAQGSAGSASEWENIAHSEAAALAKLDHPNLVRVYDVARDQEHTYIVMDRVRGVDLAHALGDLEDEEKVGADPSTRSARLRSSLEKHRLGDPEEERRTDRIVAKSWPRTCARILLQVADAIELAHQHGRVHRDLKPNNIILRPGGDPVVLDFGLSTMLRNNDDSTTLRGTPEYFAPEQARGRRTGSDVRTDVYQLGLVLYEMLTLERAQTRGEKEEVLALLNRVAEGMSGRVEGLPTSIPLSLRAICEQALHPDPELRYARVGEMAEDLARFLAHLPNRHAETSLGHMFSTRMRWLARKPAFVGAALVAVSLSLGLWARADAMGRWDPPTITPFHYFVDRKGQPEPVPVLSPLGEKDAVQFRPSRNDMLGVLVEGAKPAFLYAFALSGDGTEQGTRIRPIAAHLLGTLPPDGDGTEGLPVPEGRSQVACSYIDGRDHKEGLLVFAAEERDPSVESWIKHIEGVNTTNGIEMSLNVALLGMESLLRGGRGGKSGKELSPVDQQRIVESVKNLGSGAQRGLSSNGRLAWFRQIFDVKPQEQ